ncbi:release factor glutamine methyltransferase [Shewanella hanedai]|uniref:Release factor glutamine methyltransferase n=1 Tax=Shewanella hanedai TaxID=25 RepID=A0A553JNY5_SHEHA|nr:peptide chain release factor N(5)-glutamine methyltransferase [Shewanella hanedai]TRY14165.1 peptide chain release factor N(5)-glutamine methyltransferase [Shewanella hanedai]GGI83465.1 release factor glutamine methyltransferase [Shewanella hanedai]
MYHTLSEALAWASPQLLDVSDTPKLDAEVMLLHIIHKQRGYLYTWPDERLTSEQITDYTKMVARRVIGTPIAHIVGEREFWSLPFMVNPTTLIPRPDTEILVETALNLPLAETAKVLDLGTGTGAIALSLAYEKPQWQITAVDKIIEAVALAKANRAHLKLPQVEIVQSDWFDSISCYDFDLIVSNPPYIDETDAHLEEGDVRFEPHSALTASEHGFADLYHIAECARDYLKPGGYLLLEHGFGQAIQLRDKMIELGYENVATVRDFGSNDRCTLGRWPR